MMDHSSCDWSCFFYCDGASTTQCFNHSFLHHVSSLAHPRAMDSMSSCIRLHFRRFNRTTITNNDDVLSRSLTTRWCDDAEQTASYILRALALLCHRDITRILYLKMTQRLLSTRGGGVSRRLQARLETHNIFIYHRKCPVTNGIKQQGEIL